MKLKIILLSLVGLTATSMIALARIDAPAADTTQPAVAPASEAAPATTTTAAAAAPSADTAAPATTPATPADTTATATAQAAPADSGANTPAAPAPAAPATPATPADSAANTPAAPAAPAAATPAAPADSAANTPAAPAPVAPAPADTVASAPATSTTPASSAPAQRDPNSVIPSIIMDDVALTDAIKNLARQAGLNYMLDPKINYGAVGPDGHVSNPQPSVSLRWENITADQALNALLNNYNLVIVDDPKTKIARITIKDPAAPDPLTTKIIQLKYAYATNLLLNAQAVLLDKRSKVMADARTSQLVVVATDKEMVSIDELVARLDTPTKQVLIEAKLVETSKNPTTAKGIDWSGTLQAQHAVFGNGLTTGNVISSTGSTSGNLNGTVVGNTAPPFATVSPTAGTGSSSGTTFGQLLNTTTGNGGISVNTSKGFFPSTAFLNADGVAAVLSFLNTSADAQVLSTPRAVTLDNEEATLAVTVAQPIFNTTAGTQGSPGGAQVLYTNLGTILKVTPRISANNSISLRVTPEVSDIGGTITKTVGGLVYQADFYDIRKVTTQVLIPSGNTLVMGGLVSDNRSRGSTKVPILGDLPLLGWAFHQENKTQNKRNLVIFITPTIVQNEDFQPTETSFLKTKIKEKPITDFGVWDSGDTQDWSKLFHGKKTADAGDSGN